MLGQISSFSVLVQHVVFIIKKAALTLDDGQMVQQFSKKVLERKMKNRISKKRNGAVVLNESFRKKNEE